MAQGAIPATIKSIYILYWCTYTDFSTHNYVPTALQPSELSLRSVVSLSSMVLKVGEQIGCVGGDRDNYVSVIIYFLYL